MQYGRRLVDALTFLVLLVSLLLTHGRSRQWSAGGEAGRQCGGHRKSSFTGNARRKTDDSSFNRQQAPPIQMEQRLATSFNGPWRESPSV